MQTTSNPKWWTTEHDGAWERIREAMRRDWEQTKYDFDLGGKPLDQDVTNTVGQAAGSEPIPARSVPNPAEPHDRWDDIQGPLAYGYGARLTYGGAYPTWNRDLETKLAQEWRESERGPSHPWESVKNVVRRGYNYVVSKA